MREKAQLGSTRKRGAPDPIDEETGLRSSEVAGLKLRLEAQMERDSKRYR